MGPFGVTDLRETVCDFSTPLYSENNAILMVRPTLQNDMAGFVKPFTGQVRRVVTGASIARRCVRRTTESYMQ